MNRQKMKALRIVAAAIASGPVYAALSVSTVEFGMRGVGAGSLRSLLLFLVAAAPATMLWFFSRSQGEEFVSSLVSLVVLPVVVVVDAALPGSRNWVSEYVQPFVFVHVIDLGANFSASFAFLGIGVFFEWAAVKRYQGAA